MTLMRGDNNDTLESHNYNRTLNPKHGLNIWKQKKQLQC